MRPPELTLVQKNEFLDHAIEVYINERSVVICHLFRTWYNRKFGVKETSWDSSSLYPLVSFPELLNSIWWRLTFQFQRANVNHHNETLDFDALRPGKLTPWDYRLKLIKKVKRKINKRSKS